MRIKDIRNKLYGKNTGITLIALLITLILHYDYFIKYSNSNGFLKAIV